MRDEAGFRSFVEANGATLLHAARLLTGDHHRGEDLVQTALTKVYQKWGRIDAPLPYARKALVTAHIDQSRRKWWGERPTETLPEPPSALRAGHRGDAGHAGRHREEQLLTSARAVTGRGRGGWCTVMSAPHEIAPQRTLRDSAGTAGAVLPRREPCPA